VVETPSLSVSVPVMRRLCGGLPTVRHTLGIRCAGRGPCSAWPPVNASKRSRNRCSVHPGRFDGPVSCTNNQGWKVFSPIFIAWDALWRFPPLQRAQIVELACLEPIAKGLHITHWSSADLARQAVADGIIPAISARTIRRILKAVHLQPHRTRYWKTARVDAQFKDRAEKVLWCYSQAARWAQRGFWTVCVDECPNHQILERRPLRRAIPGAIEQQEFEYIRHGTVNLLLFLIVHSGHMEMVVEPRKDAAHYIEALRAFRQRHTTLKGLFLIQDGDPSHTAHQTQQYFAQDKEHWWRSRYTPVHASWLNQAEILINNFSYHYLKRQSWASQEAFIEHVQSSSLEYNERYAKPIEWTWTNQKMRQWYEKHTK